MKIQVIKKGSRTTAPIPPYCPWLIEMPVPGPRK